jgi:hypothetical protein
LRESYRYHFFSRWKGVKQEEGYEGGNTLQKKSREWRGKKGKDTFGFVFGAFFVAEATLQRNLKGTCMTYRLERCDGFDYQ